jgi:hypothetical protein
MSDGGLLRRLQALERGEDTATADVAVSEELNPYELHELGWAEAKRREAEAKAGVYHPYAQAWALRGPGWVTR